MTACEIEAVLRAELSLKVPLPGGGQTPHRHRLLMAMGRRNLSLARLAEAHWDAVAILAEAGREPVPGAVYGVWASEKPGQGLTLRSGGKGSSDGGAWVNGTKAFCSGAGLIDRVLLTVTEPQALLFDVGLQSDDDAIEFDRSVWKTDAFGETGTSQVTFRDLPVLPDQQVGDAGFYLDRPGFWHGACGPAACWAGGAVGLVDYAILQSRDDPHTVAHLGAMQSAVWALGAYLQSAGEEIDAAPANKGAARIRARTVRHLVEQACTEILRRLPRAYGPYPLAMDAAVSRRYQELDIYLRQWHGERDLEALGRDLLLQTRKPPG